MKRYTHIVLRRMPPLNGFSIKTPEAKFLSDIRPRGIVRELNRLNDRIKRLEEQLMDTNNKHSVLIADVVLNEDRAEQIKRLRKANLQLREGAEEQKQRIKRLEELGDWMRHHSNNDWWCEKWDEAKEAKL